jgi:hypothetical protein
MRLQTNYYYAFSLKGPLKVGQLNTREEQYNYQHRGEKNMNHINKIQEYFQRLQTCTPT